MKVFVLRYFFFSADLLTFFRQNLIPYCPSIVLEEAVAEATVLADFFIWE